MRSVNLTNFLSFIAKNIVAWIYARSIASTCIFKKQTNERMNIRVTIPWDNCSTINGYNYIFYLLENRIYKIMAINCIRVRSNFNLISLIFHRHWHFESINNNTVNLKAIVRFIVRNCKLLRKAISRRSKTISCFRTRNRKYHT